MTELTEIGKRENMILIQPGEFRMGSPINEIGRKADESIHTVRITYPFWIKKFEVSQNEWNLLAHLNDKKGALVFQLTSNLLNQICASSGYVGGHFSIEEFQGSQSIEIHLVEAVERATIRECGRVPKILGIIKLIIKNLRIWAPYLPF